ncbi:MAG TPA: pitrilysin family protein [Chitinophagales bacterium]|nr:pitrilysin family protein [Chitinophagales bacterium]
MIGFKKGVLSNGLKILVHEDDATPLAAVNILYNVGSRDETPDQTGFAHLFEHLMFGGSHNIPIFDGPLQKAGGENNAFTSTDITNYYETLPAPNLETALWLESDRMNELAFSEHSLDVQRKVVCEEFKEHYINQPYGDVWHKLRELAYNTHPYQWPTIGKKLAHIEEARLSDVKSFFYKYYRPDNAILVVAGAVKSDEIFSLAEKWFGNIPAGKTPARNLPKEPVQTGLKTLSVQADVPLDAIYKTWHMPARMDAAYYAADLITDVLSGGKSSRLYQSLVKERKLFSEINAYQTGSIDPGLIVVEGKLVKGVTMEQADKGIDEEISKITGDHIDETELMKVKNRVESQIIFSETELLNKTMNLAYYELLGDADLVNEEVNHYLKVDAKDILTEARNIFTPDNCSVLYYHSKN